MDDSGTHVPTMGQHRKRTDSGGSRSLRGIARGIRTRTSDCRRRDGAWWSTAGARRHGERGDFHPELGIGTSPYVTASVPPRAWAEGSLVGVQPSWMSALPNQNRRSDSRTERRANKVFARRFPAHTMLRPVRKPTDSGGHAVHRQPVQNLDFVDCRNPRDTRGHNAARTLIRRSWVRFPPGPRTKTPTLAAMR